MGGEIAEALEPLLVRHQQAQRHAGPGCHEVAPARHYPKKLHVGGKDVNRDANCAANVNNPSR
jgi:hypothetical protein